MANTFALITKLEGQAWIRDADGNLQPLRVGMRIPMDAEIITAAGAQLALQGGESGTLQVAESQQLKLTEDLFKTADPTESALTNPADADVNALITALNQGQDPLAQLDPTAAALAGGDGAGSTYVRLSSVIENTTPLALQYPRSVASQTADFISGGVIEPEAPAPQAGIGSDAKSVYEAGLGQEATTEAANGSITVSASDGISSITIGGVSFTLAQLLGDVGLLPFVNTGEGTLRITGYAPGANNQAGTVSYEYTLNAAQTHAPGDGSNTLQDRIEVSVAGNAGGTAIGSIVITIVDDVPVAASHAATSVTEDGIVLVEGNVTTATGNGFGMDGAAVANPVTWSTPTATLNGSAVDLSDFGTLVQNSNGAWSFELDNDKPATQALKDGESISVTLGYTLADKDGDVASADVKFTITGTEDKPTVESFEHDIAEDSGAYTVGGNALSGSTLGDGTAGEHAFAWTGAQTGQYGTVTLNPNGTYSYTLNNDSAAVQALVEGATLTETFTYTYTD
ncbi:retention module-containing protein, partial [Comamonas jiangduensis]